MTSHFDKLSVSADAETLLMYLSVQMDLMPDKYSEKYKRMGKMIEIINRMRYYYDEMVKENSNFIDRLMDKDLLTEAEINKHLEISREQVKPYKPSMTLPEGIEMIEKTPLKQKEFNDEQELIEKI